MVGYMALEEQVEKDFSLARRKALSGRHKAATSGERRLVNARSVVKAESE